MPENLRLIEVALGSFLLGSIPFGLLIARLFHVKDLRARGSGNIGATNVARLVGFWPAGVITFVLDLGKGALPVIVGKRFGLPDETWLLGLIAVLGHCYSPWLRFRGGKGVATGFGAILVLSPIAALAGATGFFLMFLERRIGSLASLMGISTASVTHLVLYPAGSYLWFAASMVLVILFRHGENLHALLENTEDSF